MSIRIGMAAIGLSLALSACGSPVEQAPANDAAGDTMSASENSETPGGGGSPSTAAPVSSDIMPSAPATAQRADADDTMADACGASKVAPWIGEPSTVPVRRAVARAANAESDRWIYPDSIVTQDLRMARLNVEMERGTDIIRRAYCG